jgi:hypothetical protein
MGITKNLSMGITQKIEKAFKIADSIIILELKRR